MKNANYAFRYLLKSRGSNITRTISLTLGLTVALVMFTYVNFQLTYDRFYPNQERIYQVWTTYGDDMISSQMAPIAPAMAQDIPQIEAATRLHGIYHYDFFVDEEPFELAYRAADTSFFDVLDFGVIAGDPKEIFLDKMQIMLSQSQAKKMFGDKNPIGQVIMEKGQFPITVGGIFKDPPLNTHLGQFNALIPFDRLNDTGMYTGWGGGDSFPTYFLLKEGASIAEVEAQIPAFCDKYHLTDMMTEWKMSMIFVPIAKSNTISGGVEMIAYILSALALLTLFVACMNYVLASISTMVSRSKTFAMLRCNGAQKSDIFKLFLYETFFIILAALMFSAMLIFTLQDSLSALMDNVPISELFAFNRIGVPFVVVIVTFLLAGLIPARMFANIPLQAAFKGTADSKKGWKKALLFMQITSTSLVVTLLVTITMQFDLMSNGEMGYEKDNLVFAMPFGNQDKVALYHQELTAMPEVESVGTGYSLPMYGYSGQPCYDEITKELLFSCRIDYIDHHYIPTMKMEIVDGENFSERSLATDVIVNQRYVEMRGWTDSPIGREIIDQGGENAPLYRIVGVVKDFLMYYDGDVEPIVFHSYKEVMTDNTRSYGGFNTMIRLRETSPEAIAAVTEKIKEFPSTNNHRLSVYSQVFDEMLTPGRNMRNAVMAVALITLLIAILGLLGYLNDEIKRRYKEIAIRKVNGAYMTDIIRLFARNLSFIVVPAIILGGTLSYVASFMLLKMIPNKITLSWWIFVGSALAVALVVYSIEIIRTWHTANRNPIDMIKTE